MSATANNTTGRNQPAHGTQATAQQTPNVFTKTLRLLFWLCMALFFSIISEWIGMTFWWADQGVQHSADMLVAELSYLSGDLRSTILVSDTVRYATEFSEKIYYWIWQATRLEEGIDWLLAAPSPGSSGFHITAHTVLVSIISYLKAAQNITLVFGLRLSILTLAMPAFALSALVGLLDGMVRRDLRRWGGGRESSYVYHHAKRWIFPVFIMAWILYLSIPISVHPAIAILPFAALLGLLIAITASSFKKYL